uniref:Uncharacterized protein n=1 Tax=Solanum tuberosum TaxID=4113 RepID=M1DWL0_SOLTU
MHMSEPLEVVLANYDEFKIQGYEEVVTALSEEPPNLEFKVLPSHLRYAFLGANNTLPVKDIVREEDAIGDSPEPFGEYDLARLMDCKEGLRFCNIRVHSLITLETMFNAFGGGGTWSVNFSLFLDPLDCV